MRGLILSLAVVLGQLLQAADINSADGFDFGGDIAGQDGLTYGTDIDAIGGRTLDLPGGGGGTSPGTSLWVAWYDGIDTTDSTGNGYSLSLNAGTVTANSDDGDGAKYYDFDSTGNYTATGLAAAWARSSGDWTVVARYKSLGIGDTVYGSGGGRNYLADSSGNVLGRLGALDSLTLTPSGSYTGQWITVIVAFDAAPTATTTIYFLNENGVESVTTGSVSWSGSDLTVGDGAGVIKLDFIGFADRLLTSGERAFFGDNSSEAIIWADL